jgi:hypothetical protein
MHWMRVWRLARKSLRRSLFPTSPAPSCGSSSAARVLFLIKTRFLIADDVLFLNIRQLERVLLHICKSDLKQCREVLYALGDMTLIAGQQVLAFVLLSLI